MLKLKFNPAAMTYKFEQVRDEVIRCIESGELSQDDLIPSIGDICDRFQISKVTVGRAYKHLQALGYISFLRGRGFYVNGSKMPKLKVLLVFNKLSPYKMLVYKGLLETLSQHAKIDLQLHYYDPKILGDIIQENLGKYDKYVIMPHFSQETALADYLPIIRRVPAHKLVLLDKRLPDLQEKHLAVYQDFENDIYFALESVAEQMQKYRGLALVLPPKSHHPPEIIAGVKKFCEQAHLAFVCVDSVGALKLVRGLAYMVIEDEELSSLLKLTRQKGLNAGSDIGIISFNETVLKELLHITVFTTDFEEMGRTAGTMILKNNRLRIRSHFKVIKRDSL